VAPVIAAPAGSVTRPLIVPLDWAKSNPAQANSNGAASNRFLIGSSWLILQRCKAANGFEYDHASLRTQIGVVPPGQLFYEGSPALKRFLLIFSDLILCSNVDRGMPSLAAAPAGPYTRPPLSRRAASIISFSSEGSFLKGSSLPLGTATEGRRESQLSS